MNYVPAFVRSILTRAVFCHASLCFAIMLLLSSLSSTVFFSVVSTSVSVFVFFSVHCKSGFHAFKNFSLFVFLDWNSRSSSCPSGLLEAWWFLNYGDHCFDICEERSHCWYGVILPFGVSFRTGYPFHDGVHEQRISAYECICPKSDRSAVCYFRSSAFEIQRLCYNSLKFIAYLPRMVLHKLRVCNGGKFHRDFRFQHLHILCLRT